MEFNSKKLLLNTIINPYSHSCGFITDIYLTINPSTHNRDDTSQNYVHNITRQKLKTIQVYLHKAHKQELKSMYHYNKNLVIQYIIHD